MVGVTVATLFTVIGASLKASATQGVDRTLAADLVVYQPGYGGSAGLAGFSPTLAADLVQETFEQEARRSMDRVRELGARSEQLGQRQARLLSSRIERGVRPGTNEREDLPSRGARLLLPTDCC